MSVVAKFQVTKVEQNFSHFDQNKDAVTYPTVFLRPVYNSDNDPKNENNKFWEATPNGELKMQIMNSAAAEYFDLGAVYYLTFDRAES